jgi:glycosyltransferase involved in cell wall biosynthesis
VKNRNLKVWLIKVGEQLNGPGDADALEECIRYFLKNPEIYSEYGKRTRNLFETKFDSEIIYNSCADHIEHVFERRKYE